MRKFINILLLVVILISLGLFSYNSFSKKAIKSILVVGDSISEGYGCSEYIYEESKEQYNLPVIYNDGEIVFRQQSLDCRSWVYFLREKFDNMDVAINSRSIGGRSYKENVKHKEIWIDKDYDLLIIMLGTNDTKLSETADEFILNAEEFIDYGKSKCKNVLVVIPPPIYDNINFQSDRNFTIEVLRSNLIDLCNKNKYKYIDLYEKIDTLSKEVNIMDFYGDDLHFNDKGAEKIAEIITSYLKNNFKLEKLS